MLTNKMLKICVTGVMALLPVLLFANHWAYETVDAQGSVGWYSFMRLDQNGNPHIAYFDYTNRDLKYAYKRREFWYLETVDTTLAGSNTDISLWLTPDGNPHIAYWDSYKQDLKYAYRVGGTWHVETVDTTGNTGNYPSIAVDADGVPHIVYYDFTEQSLYYAYKLDGFWHFERVDTAAWYTSIVLDGNGNPHISYYQTIDEDLKYANRIGGSWHTETVDATGDVGMHTSLLLDGNGDPHISYYDYTNDDLKYAYRSEGTWYTETVDDAGNVGTFTSIGANAEGTIHIAYRDGDNHDLKHAWKSGAFWDTETVDGVGDAGLYASLAVDANGNLHISYLNGNDEDLRYATTAVRVLYPNGGEVWHTGETQVIRWFGAGPMDIYFSPDGNEFQLLVSQVGGGSYPIVVPQVYTENAVIKVLRHGTSTMDFSDGPFSIRQAVPVQQIHVETADTLLVGQYIALTVDGNGTPHASYPGNGNLKYAYKSGGSWTIETVNTDVPWYTSIAVDSNGVPHIGYFESNNHNLKYAYKSGGSWTTETVDATGYVGLYTSIAVDGNGTPHISYYDVDNTNLKYAYKSGGTWHIETVDTAGMVGWNTSLVVDENGVPRISYYDASDTCLKYAYKSGGTWHIETVDTAGDVGIQNSLALDGNGVPHISYYDFTNADLKYAYRFGGSWHIEAVDTAGMVGRYTSLILDRNGVPHITYFDDNYSDLKHAYKSGGTWHIETIDTAGVVGWYSSLALDPHNNLHIGYYDWTHGDLKYATTALTLWSPLGGETWNVGANATLKWSGPRSVDVYISLHGGDDWQLLLHNIAGVPLGDTWRYQFQVPHIPTHYAKIKLVYANYDQDDPLNYAVSDTFFTIQATVTLLTFDAQLENDGNIHLSWNTDPGLDELMGYNIYRINTDGSETKLTTSPIRQTAFTDRPSPDIKAYALGAVNGIGEEYRIGQISVSAINRPLAVLPNITRENATAYFFVPDLTPAQSEEDVRLYIVDVTGRNRVQIFDGQLKPGFHSMRVSTDGLTNGLYFIVLNVNNLYIKTTKMQVIKN